MALGRPSSCKNRLFVQEAFTSCLNYEVSAWEKSSGFGEKAALENGFKELN